MGLGFSHQNAADVTAEPEVAEHNIEIEKEVDSMEERT